LVVGLVECLLVMIAVPGTWLMPAMSGADQSSNPGPTIDGACRMAMARRRLAAGPGHNPRAQNRAGFPASKSVSAICRRCAHAS